MQTQGEGQAMADLGSQETNEVGTSRSPSPLETFQGTKPAAPAWFVEALADLPERRMVPTARGDIEALVWGKIGNPGLLFVHGNTAQADWWSFIAPFFSASHRVAAMSLAGMGGSQWRDRYSSDDFILDAADVVEATQLASSGRKPIYIGHSFGGRQVVYTAANAPEQMAGVIAIDTLTRQPSPAVINARAELAGGTVPPNTALRSGPRDNRIYASLADAIARFRLIPPQPADNLFILDHIARTSARQVAISESANVGWQWKFDPRVMPRPEAASRPMGDPAEPDPALPLAHIVGERSAIHNRNSEGRIPAIAVHEIQVEIPAAAHHIMLDQPTALITAIRAILAAWSV